MHVVGYEPMASNRDDLVDLLKWNWTRINPHFTEVFIQLSLLNICDS